MGTCHLGGSELQTSPVNKGEAVCAATSTRGTVTRSWFGRRFALPHRTVDYLSQALLPATGVPTVVFFNIVYIHPRANALATAQLIADLTRHLDAICPDAPKFILGDFNHC